MANSGNNDQRHEGQPGGPLDVPMTDEHRAELIERAKELVAHGGLTAESAAAVDRLVESGWSGEMMPEVLASLGVAVSRQDELEAVERIERTIEARNPFSLPLPGQGEDDESQETNGSSWIVARVVSLAAAIVLGVTMFVPGLSPLITGQDGVQTGGGQVQHPAVQPNPGMNPAEAAPEESEEDEPAGPRRER